MPTAHSNVSGQSVNLNAGGLQARHCASNAGEKAPAAGLKLVRILLKHWLHRRFDALSQCDHM